MNRLILRAFGFFVVSLLLFVASAIGQEDETMRILETDHSKLYGDTLWTPHDKPVLAIVPFEPIMYKSQIDRSIGENDGTNFEQIRENFRKSLDNLLFIETDQKYSIVRMGADDAERKEDLYKLYRSTSPDYRILPQEKKEEKKLLNLKKKEKSKEQETPKGTYMHQGQVVSNQDDSPKFMARTVKDSTVFEYMYNKYGAVLYVFVNQFDVGPMPGLDYRSFESEEYQREITVHYSVFTLNKEIFSGVSKTWFSSRVNSQKDIILQSMPSLASDISSKIPVMISEKNATK